MATPGPRVRSNSTDGSSTQYLYKDNTVANTPLIYPTTFTTTEEAYSDKNTVTKVGYMSDVVVRDFWKRRAQGYVFNNPMDSSSLDTVESAASVNSNLHVTQCAYDHSNWSQHYNSSRLCNWVGDATYSIMTAGATNVGFIDLTNVPIIAVSDIQDMAVTQAWANIDQSEILALSSLKEAKTTIAGLFDTAKSAVKIFRAVKKFEIKKARGLLYSNPRTRAKKLKSIAKQSEDIYMGARYNLRPLYYDMIGVLKLGFGYTRPRQTFRGFEARENLAEDSEVFNHNGVLVPNIGTGLKFRLDRIARRTVSCRAGVLTELWDASLGDRSGIYSLAETAWDLIPYSFIADWFFNVGDTMLSWVPKPNVNVLTSWATVETVDECINTVSYVSHDPGTGPPQPWRYPNIGFTHSFTCSPATKTWRYHRKWRLPSPSRAIIPKFTMNLDSLKILDLSIILKKMVSYSRRT